MDTNTYTAGVGIYVTRNTDGTVTVDVDLSDLADILTDDSGAPAPEDIRTAVNALGSSIVRTV